MALRCTEWGDWGCWRMSVFDPFSYSPWSSYIVVGFADRWRTFIILHHRWFRTSMKGRRHRKSLSVSQIDGGRVILWNRVVGGSNMMPLDATINVIPCRWARVPLPVRCEDPNLVDLCGLRCIFDCRNGMIFATALWMWFVRVCRSLLWSWQDCVLCVLCVFIILFSWFQA